MHRRRKKPPCDGQREPTKDLTTRTQHTMVLDQSALLDLPGELKLTDVTDRIRVATETLYQELIDAEGSAFAGAAPVRAHYLSQRQPSSSTDDDRWGRASQAPEAAGQAHSSRPGLNSEGGWACCRVGCQCHLSVQQTRTSSTRFRTTNPPSISRRSWLTTFDVRAGSGFGRRGLSRRLPRQAIPV